MQVFTEVIAIIWLVILYTISAENTGGNGEDKKAKVTADVMAYIKSPGGLYINNVTLLKVIEFGIHNILIGLVVAGWNQRGFLGISTGSLSAPQKPSENG